MTETKRRTKTLFFLATKIVQKKRGVVLFLKNPQTAQTMNELLRACKVPFARTPTLDDNVPLCCMTIVPWSREKSEVVLIMGFDTTGKGHKKINLAVRSKC